MKVSQLIDSLRREDPDARVVFVEVCPCHRQMEQEINNVETGDGSDGKEVWVY